MVVKSLKRTVKIAIVILLLPVYAHAWDCSVSISGPNTVEMGESITLTASGNRYGGDYSWSAWPSSSIASNGSSAVFTGKLPGKTTVWISFYAPGKWYCYSGKEITVTGEAWLKKTSGDNQKGVKGSYLYEPLIVEVVDKNNKPVSGAQITYQVKQNPPGTYWWEKGTLSTSYAYTDSSGRASSKLKLGAKLGTYVVEASCSNCTSGSPQTFTAEAVTVTLKKETGDNQSGQMKKELKEPFVVKVTDATGAGVGGVYVSFSVAQKPSGSTGSYPSPSYTYTNADGTAASTLILGDKTGDYKVNAYCYAASGGSPQTFTAKAEDVNYTMSKVSGDEQNGYIEKPLKDPFAVKVIDANSKPVENLPIQWVITKMPDGAKGTSFSYATTTTASDGTTGTTLTFGDTHGVYTVEARCDQCGNTSPQVFTIEALGMKLELYPEYSELWPQKTDGIPKEAKIRAALKYTDGISVTDPYPVDFETKATTSKGHDHGIHPSEKAGKLNNSSCTINNGECSVAYTSSEIAGIEEINALVRGKTEIKDAKEITVKVPGLGPLGANTYWRLTGNAGPTSTKKCNGKEINHSENHMATFSTAIRVAMMAKAYSEKKKGRLGINDMSLAWGGLFDICSDWEKPHGLHRKGKSVDIDRSAQSVTNSSIFVDVQRDYLDELADSFNGSPVPEGTIHYEFP